MAYLPRPAIRRPISIAIVATLGLVTVVLSPLVVPLLWTVDLLQRHPTGRLSRAWVFLATTLTTEVLGIATAGASWVWYLGRRRTENWVAHSYRLEFWRARMNLFILHHVAGITFRSENPEALQPGCAIVVGRHASHIDAVAPLYALDQAGQLPRYTLKHDLQWLPSMDILGNRTRNVWIDRGHQTGSATFAAIEALAADLDETSSAIIFPEGTFFTAARRDRAVARLCQARPDLAEKASRLRYLLPPKPAGTLALMRGAPDADLVIMANVGVEKSETLQLLLASITEKRTLRIKSTRYCRLDVPTDQSELTEWLLDRWLEMDEWIHEHRTRP